MEYLGLQENDDDLVNTEYIDNKLAELECILSEKGVG